jgi:NADH/NAD ratio-sensing transcriptional regulator Rex
MINALLVGATIEDLDIYDLDEFMKKTTNTDILTGFQFLTCGSRNHMRAFVSQLVDNGAVYKPVYISLSEFNDIINSSREQCGQMP